MKYFVILIIPLLGTTIGSFLCYFLKSNINKNLNKLILGFSAGVMMASSIWSLIIPAIKYSPNKYTGAIYVSIGLILGVISFMLIDLKLDKVNQNKLNWAVIIHNIPEGFCVGIGLGIAITNPLLLSDAFALSLGIGIQNIPEGSIISLNSLSTCSKKKSFFLGFVSGVVEPIASIIAILILFIIKPLMPFFLSFAAGVMFYVILKELLSEANSNIGILGYILGFIIMMILDILL